MPAKKKQTKKFLSVTDIDFDELMEGRRKLKEEQKQKVEEEKLKQLENDLNKSNKRDNDQRK